MTSERKSDEEIEAELEELVARYPHLADCVWGDKPIPPGWGAMGGPDDYHRPPDPALNRVDRAAALEAVCTAVREARRAGASDWELSEQLRHAEHWTRFDQEAGWPKGQDGWVQWRARRRRFRRTWLPRTGDAGRGWKAKATEYGYRLGHVVEVAGAEKARYHQRTGEASTARLDEPGTVKVVRAALSAVHGGQNAVSWLWTLADYGKGRTVPPAMPAVVRAVKRAGSRWVPLEESETW